MHIVWVTTHAAPVGGCERMIQLTVRELARRGVRSTLLYQPNDQVEQAYLQEFHAAFPLVDWRLQLRAIDADLIYVHQVEGVESLEALTLCRAPVVRFFHDYRLLYECGSRFSTPIGGMGHRSIGFVHGGPWRFRSIATIRRELELSRSFDAQVVGSEQMRLDLLAHGFAPEKVHVLPLFASRPTESNAEREEGVVLFAGQLLRGKGLDVLLEALKRCKTPCQLVIAGEGRQEQQLRQQVAELRLGGRVRFLGKLDEATLSQWMARVCCLVLPHRLPESFGLVGPEAMRHGTPTIASALGGVTEWLRDGQNGLAVPPGNAPALALALDEMLTNAPLRERLGVQAKLDYEARFTPEAHCDGFLNLCHQFTAADTSVGFSVRGGSVFEQKMQQLTQDIAQVVQQNAEVRALILFGGYGKGEGGVRIAGDGTEKPNNNLDLLCVMDRSQPGLQEKLSELCQPLGLQNEIGIDLSVTSEQRLRRGASSLMWQDTIAGHKTLLGDPEVVLRLPVRKISSTEILRLLINRGTLLVINDWLRAQGKSEPTKHVVKAIIGYGDALLYYLGDLHWSYQRKRQRMAQRRDIDPAFAALYEKACAYRLQPDPATTFDDPREALATVFLQCERLRLRDPALTLGSYRTGLWTGQWKEIAAAFPQIAFVDPTNSAARDRYLALWGDVADKNFSKALAQLAETT